MLLHLNMAIGLAGLGWEGGPEPERRQSRQWQWALRDEEVM